MKFMILSLCGGRLCATCTRKYPTGVSLKLLYVHRFSFEMPKSFFYAVRTGRAPGLYSSWNECESQVKGFPNAQYKKFPSKEMALEFVNQNASSVIGTDKEPSRSFGSLSNHANSYQHFNHESLPIFKPEKPSKKTFYAVHIGRNPGVYDAWTDCEAQIKDMKIAKYRKFDSEQDALDFVKTGNIVTGDSKLEKTSRQNVRKAYYAVHVGRKRGVYDTWTECEAQIKDLKYAKYRKFDTEHEAMHFSETGKPLELEAPDNGCPTLKRVKLDDDYVVAGSSETVTIYTDGASSANGKSKAKAGIGIFWGPDHPLNTSQRLQGRQTNNRAEIYAAIHALRQAKDIGARKVNLYTDSKFLINGITDWINKWKKNGWKLSDGKDVINKDDFIELDEARQGLEVKWLYVKAHNNDPGNEAADRLAVEGAKLPLKSPADDSVLF